MARPQKSKDSPDRQLLIQPPEVPIPEGATVLFKPASANQELALLTPCEDILTGGAKAGGKSYVGRAFLLKGNPDLDPNASPANVSYVLHPSYTALVLRRTYKEMLDWVNMAREFYCNPNLPKNFRAVWKEEPQFFEWPSGARAYVSHLKNADSANHKKGFSVLHRILIEELTESIDNPDQFFELKSLMRSLGSTPELRCQLMATTNFNGPGLDWVQGYWLYDPKTGLRHPDKTPLEVEVVSPISGKVHKSTRIFIPFKLTDNPHISADYEFRLAALPEHMRQVYLEGNPESLNGSQFFPEFRVEPRPGEPVGAVHVVDEKDLYWEDWEPTFASFDWGYSHKAVMLIGTEKKSGPAEGKLVIREELIMRRMTDVAMGERIAETIYPYLNDQRPTMVLFVDPSIMARWIEASPMESVVGRLKTGIDMVLGPGTAKVLKSEDLMKQWKHQEGMKIVIRPAENRRVHGWGVMRQMLDWSPLKEERPKFDQQYAMRLTHKPDLFLEYVQKMKRVEEEHRSAPRLVLLKGKCPELQAGIKRAVFDNDGDVLKVDCDINTGVGGDDAIDACRYLCVGAQRIKAKEPEEVWLEKQLAVWRENLRPRTVEEDFALRVKLRKQHEEKRQTFKSWGRRGIRLVG